jgi:hypothetical protein
MQRPTEILLSSAAGSNNAPRENGRACIPAAVCSYWLPGQSPPLTKACHSPPLWRQPSPPAPVRLDLTPALQRMGVGVGVAMGDTLPACLPMLPLPLPLPASAGCDVNAEAHQEVKAAKWTECPLPSAASSVHTRRRLLDPRRFAARAKRTSHEPKPEPERGKRKHPQPSPVSMPLLPHPCACQ